MNLNSSYYSAVQLKFKPLVISPFCHDFCSKKNKNPAKTTNIDNMQPQAKAWGN